MEMHDEFLAQAAIDHEAQAVAIREARYQLFRLHQLLAGMAALLRAEGHHGAEVDGIAADALALSTRMLALRRTEAAARRATCATC